jgi:uncharacterized repeat protein (TIGR01451 family)
MKTIRQTKLIFGMVAAMSSSAIALQAQCTFPLHPDQHFDITGFEVRPAPTGGKHYTFVPQCATGDCPEHVLRAYNLIWDFGDGTYSFESVPVHVYAAASPAQGFQVSLKSANIYEEPDRISEAAPSGIKICDVATQPLIVDNSANPNVPRVELVAWQPIAKKGHEMKYIASFHNKRGRADTFTAEFRADPGLSLFDSQGRPYPLTYNQQVIGKPMVIHDANGDRVIFKGSVAANAHIQVIITGKVDDDMVDTVVTSNFVVSYSCNEQGGDCRKNDEAQSAQPIGEEWDPNLLISTPEHFTVPGEFVQFTVNFENMGTGRADSITIIDSLPEAADMSTLEIISTSHPTKIGSVKKDGHVLVIVFPKIRLPAADANEGDGTEVPNYMARNQGFITFRVRLASDLAVGEKVENQAYIGFDRQPLIPTNKTKMTVPSDMYILSKPMLGSN